MMMVAEIEPFGKFNDWLGEAAAAEPNDPNAMTLATARPDGTPSARIVLLKSVDPQGVDPQRVGPRGAAERRGLVFYSNRESRKAAELAANQRVALLFHWKSLQRQVRIEGRVEPAGEAEADAYFATRARISRLGAWASDQSRRLPDRAELERRLAAFEARFPGDDIPRPPHWGGYRVIPAYFEFWQDMPFRLHDRITYTRDGDDWITGKLFP